MDWIWVLIPLAAILMGGFKQWLSLQQTQRKLGTSTHELEQEMDRLKKALASSESERRALVSRLQNLETIVTSQMWDVVHDPALPEADRTHALDAARATLPLPEATDDDAERAARLANRLRT
jgi:hypothetical protein